jgi:HSP20 family molecular chaperone IbpA
MSDAISLTKQEEHNLEQTRPVRTVAPQVDIYENKDEILLYAEMPGIDKENLSIHIDNGKLTLTGNRKLQSEGAPTWEEFGDVQYQRTLSVPQTIDIAKVNAELHDGILRLHLPKSEAAKPRHIEIKSA